MSQREKILHVAFDPVYAHPLPEGHRFPMLKYELIPGQLIYEGTITEASLVNPFEVVRERVLQVHTLEYFHQLIEQTLPASAQRKIGFPLTPALVKRELVITQGTIDCAHAAMRDGVALNVAGGTHHAFAGHGEGFCLLNDFAIAAMYLLDEKLAKQILVVDLDVHQGNGTAKIFEDEPRVFTFSMHGDHNYPFHKEKSDLDVPLHEGTGDAVYLDLLRDALPVLLARVKPDFVFYLSGVDVLSTDRFGKLKLTVDGCRSRDRFVLETMKKQGIPCAISMGGGYSADIRVIVEAHCNTFRVAKDVFF